MQGVVFHEMVPGNDIYVQFFVRYHKEYKYQQEVVKLNHFVFMLIHCFFCIELMPVLIQDR